MQTGGNPEVLTHVSQNVRRLRLAADLSQAALAEISGVSRRTVIKLEAGEANISLTGLDHLAEALGVTFVDLVAAPTAPRTTINEITWRGEGPQSVATLMSAVPATKETQLWSWSLEPGERYHGEPDPEGWSEMIFVSEGSLRIDGENESVALHTGEHFTFPSSQHYSYTNPGQQITRFVRVVVS
ncbi:helix-turn-helix domain-containing protein [Glutamicibacter sp. NPDC087344]|uniref:helix-turn-helix domain-containing protein n=1 Tax=Glutamicibacter sp. NPDC087344 TaxID=3363994 RepID=UPI00382004E4